MRCMYAIRNEGMAPSTIVFPCYGSKHNSHHILYSTSTSPPSKNEMNIIAQLRLHHQVLHKAIISQSLSAIVLDHQGPILVHGACRDVCLFSSAIFTTRCLRPYLTHVLSIFEPKSFLTCSHAIRNAGLLPPRHTQRFFAFSISYLLGKRMQSLKTRWK